MIVVQLLGGMANQMFQYALGRHLAMLNNTELYLDTSLLSNRIPLERFTFRQYELGDFDIMATIADASVIPLYPSNQSIKSLFHRGIHLLKIFGKRINYVRESNMAFDPTILKLKGNVYLDGNWQSEKYFHAISSLIRREFTYNKQLPTKILELQQKMRSEESICVHVRRGDYLMTEHHGTVSTNYISAGISHIISQTNSPVVYVFSNDLEWCRKNLDLKLPYYFVDSALAGENDKEHFVLMQSCAHFIIANSSFSWWAAYLGDNPTKIVVAPKNWLSNAKYDTSDIYLDSWKVI